MTALKCVFEVVVKENARERLGQNRLKRSYLGEEALHVDWRVFPVQPQFDGDLGDLADDADNAYNPERVGHMYVSLRQFDEIARPVGERRGS
jgi:hypothetical protein